MSYLAEDRFSCGEAHLYQLFINDADGKFKFELQEKSCLRGLRPVKGSNWP